MEKVETLTSLIFFLMMMILMSIETSGKWSCNKCERSLNYTSREWLPCDPEILSDHHRDLNNPVSILGHVILLLIRKKNAYIFSYESKNREEIFIQATFIFIFFLMLINPYVWTHKSLDVSKQPEKSMQVREVLCITVDPLSLCLHPPPLLPYPPRLFFEI